MKKDLIIFLGLAFLVILLTYGSAWLFPLKSVSMSLADVHGPCFFYTDTKEMECFKNGVDLPIELNKHKGLIYEVTYVTFKE